MKLYTYWRSSAAYRIRIALNIKNIPCKLVSMNLIAKENREPWYLEKNPTALVPVLELNDGVCIRQSLAIIDYLEKQCPHPPLLHTSFPLRTKALEFACDIGMEIHPINNLRLITYLKEHHNFSQKAVVDWMHHWMHITFAALEKQISPNAEWCFGGQPSVADVFLVPQIYNAQRWELDLTLYPNLLRINEHAQKQPAFAKAHPDLQSDSPLS